MGKLFSSIFLCLLCNDVTAQVHFSKVEKNHYRFDCEMLRAVLKDSTLFDRKHWSKESNPVVLNDFNSYFDSCTVGPLYNRRVITIHQLPRQLSDTLTIGFVRKKEDHKYEIEFVRPSSGGFFRLELVKSGLTYKARKILSGEY